MAKSASERPRAPTTMRYPLPKSWWPQRWIQMARTVSAATTTAMSLKMK